MLHDIILKGFHMALNREYIGRRHDTGEYFEVNREQIRDYAIATGDMNPAYLDAEFARKLGYPDVIAPPLFDPVLFFRFGSWPMFEPEFGKKKLPYCVLVSQQISYSRPLHAGDRVRMTTIVTDIADIGQHEKWVMTNELITDHGEQVASIVTHVVSRGTAEKGS
jgi:acyl dehydratase